MAFKTSSYCDTAACVEVDTTYSKSDPIEATGGEGRVGVRDSKNPGSPVLGFSPAAWIVFTGSLRP